MNEIDQHYQEQMQRRAELSRFLSRLNEMDPKERSAVLKEYGFKPKEIGQMAEGERQDVEGKEPETEPVSIFESPEFLALGGPLVMGFKPVISLIGSILFGKGASEAVKVTGGTTLEQEIADIIGSFFNPEAEEKLLQKYGPEVLAEMQSAKGAEQNVELLKKLRVGIESGEIKPEQLSVKFTNKLKGILKAPRDAELRALRPGFVSASVEEEIFKAQSRRINRINHMLNVLRKSGPEEQKLLLPVIADEFVKYQQLAVSKVSQIDNKGNTVYRLAKHAWSDSELEDIRKFAEHEEFPSVIDRIIHPLRNEKGSLDLFGPLQNQHGGLDPKMFLFAKNLIGKALSAENLYKAEVYAQLMNPVIAIRKVATDVMFLPWQRTAQSFAMAKEHMSLTAGMKTWLSANYALLQSFPEAIRIFKATLKSGEPEFEKMFISAVKEKLEEEAGKHLSPSKLRLELNKLGFQGHAFYGLEAFDNTLAGQSANWLGSWYAKGAHSVLAADQFAKLLAERSSRRMYAFHLALEEAESAGVKGMQRISLAEQRAEEMMQEMPDQLLRAQVKDMYKSTFTDEGEWIKYLSKMPKPFRILFPYIRTPMNLAKEGYKGTPLGFLPQTIFGDEKGLEASTTQAKAAMGSILAGLIAWEVMKGNITGSGPSNRNKYNMNLPEPYTAFGHSYQHLGPLATYISLVADATEGIANAEPSDAMQVGEAVTKALASSFANLPTMTGMTNLVHAFDEVKKGKMEALGDFLGQEVAGFIPAPIRMGAEVNDPEYKDARGFVDKMRKNIPGLSHDLPPYRKWDGEPQYLPPGVTEEDTAPDTGSVLLNMLSPAPERHQEMDDLDKELARLGVFFGRTPDHRKIGDQIVPLNPQQKDEWSQLAGSIQMNNKNQRQAGNDLIKQDFYTDPKTTDEQRKMMLKGNHHAYVGLAWSQVYQHHFQDMIRPPEGPTTGGLTQEKPPSEVGFGGR